MHSSELQTLLHGNALDESDYFAQQLIKGLELLSIEQRVAINLHDLLGYTLLELSEIMEMPVGTLKSHLHRGRKQLQKHLELKPEMLAHSLQHRG